MNQLATTSAILKLRGNDIVKYERQVDFASILQSGEASLMKLKKDNYDALYDFAVECAGQYLKICYPNQLGLAPVIASDLIETRPSWKAADMINLFKFARQRQDIKEISELSTQGNQMTVPKFMSIVAVYEENRAQAMEHLHNSQKGERVKEQKTLNDYTETIAKRLEKKYPYEPKDEVMGKEFDKLQAQKEKDGHTVYPSVNHERFFEGNKK